ncbi:MAG: DUF1353 domain-containing protein [Candidatus Gastranaerophilales bacterium]|nr:DUF1353 domain-containing protein [Candidatus Gastranaerophilales bacterium]
MNICWYEDEDLKIVFNKVPNLSMRFIMPCMKQDLIDEINKKPFISNDELYVILIDKIFQITYEFSIPKDYTWDGASIPRIFWRLIGSKTDNRFLVPSLIHDVLCENHNYIDDNRYFSTIVFERLLYVSKVNSFNRWMIKHAVDNYQKFCGWDN